MPTYVYRFVDTGETIEVQQSFDEPTLTEAPHPGDGQPRPVKKVFTPVGITFKGNGFYKTDSRGSKASSSSGAKSTDSSSSSDSSSSDSSSSSGSGSSSSGSSSSNGSSSKEKATSSSGSGSGSGATTGAGGHSH
jgi:predicted nucleic acid-binding Zn ribbon protein